MKEEKKAACLPKRSEGVVWGLDLRSEGYDYRHFLGEGEWYYFCGKPAILVLTTKRAMH